VSLKPTVGVEEYGLETQAFIGIDYGIVGCRAVWTE